MFNCTTLLLFCTVVNYCFCVLIFCRHSLRLLFALMRHCCGSLLIKPQADLWVPFSDLVDSCLPMTLRKQCSTNHVPIFFSRNQTTRRHHFYFKGGFSFSSTTTCISSHRQFAIVGCHIPTYQYAAGTLIML